MRIFSELLFQHGHIADVALAQRLAESDTAVDALQPQTSLESPESTAAPRQDMQTMPDPLSQRRRERRMARLSRRLLRGVTALSPFR
ncbi:MULTISPECIES: hypothetical protein [Xanthomonas]|uniref:Uncharacterized protein n=1 Tax=Xanthomonas phaseoli pv. dieffenbachiae TaxID=92828 RepID=A0A1V9H7V2_9XANT|nr:hypothetical protein [Xanthomonas phaseoli]MBO9768723.1 hypothetical protein [Xanthomonas phaseoli pv. dieffenbachiae]MBO9776922.1 hypothetical protein [Xanthomonas phaseoli pv. dieffenbachiae]MBO9781849.1 hypothetical protein [Xanthomonas phaseoli pv. dieffenbachiae]MBO9787361.1 hypothetical protein [Xanthomonas phaseoli pv. dieffenbachiae]MBO9797434.1 hypothetical protein [Xanthomonas phaseoli pv. dieffenbachiae]